MGQGRDTDEKQLSSIRAGVSETKVHLAQDRVFIPTPAACL